MKTSGTVLTLALAVAAMGCDRVHEVGGQADLKTLTAADVLEMPIGSAGGQGFSGSFTSRSSHIDACVCRTGSCSMLMARTGDTHQVAQQDGRLTIDPGLPYACVGGVNEDGTFWCGYSWIRGSGSELSRQHGAFTVVNGTPTSLLVITELTWGIPGSPGLDCDLQNTAELDYVGPLTSP